MKNERRLYPRFRLATQFNVMVIDPGVESPEPYRVVDFSRGGMRLEAAYRPDSPSPERSLNARLTIRFGRAPAGEVAARMVRESGAELAVEFLDPDSKTLDRLHGDVMKHVSSEEAMRQVGVVLDAVDED